MAVLLSSAAMPPLLRVITTAFRGDESTDTPQP
jgi:hypothetical protein